MISSLVDHRCVIHCHLLCIFYLFLSESFGEGCGIRGQGLRDGQLLHRNVQRFRSGLVFKTDRRCVSLNSRLESNKGEDEEADSPWCSSHSTWLSLYCSWLVLRVLRVGIMDQGVGFSVERLGMRIKVLKFRVHFI